MPLLPAAIGIILNADQTQVLLVKRQDIAVWVLPGGGIENHEKSEEALIREVEEETGYQVKILRPCAKYYPINRLASLTFVFICEIQSGVSCLSSETKEIAFFPIDQLPSSFLPLHNNWLKEGLAHSYLVVRNLTEVSYFNFFHYFLLHPWQVLRFIWTRLTKN